jgi:hypothetical protein
MNCKLWAQNMKQDADMSCKSLNSLPKTAGNIVFEISLLVTRADHKGSKVEVVTVVDLWDVVTRDVIIGDLERPRNKFGLLRFGADDAKGTAFQ